MTPKKGLVKLESVVMGLDLTVCKALDWVPKLKSHQTGVTTGAGEQEARQEGDGRADAVGLRRT